MDSFSWSDSFRAAFASCLPCARSADSDDEHLTTNEPRRDELERLLESSDDAEADAMSLHSNLNGGSGRGRRTKKKRGQRKSIRVFGYDLFGRPLPPSLSDDDEREREEEERERSTGRYTVDSDAAPLEDATIADLSRRWEPAQTEEELAAEEAAQREREERRARRKERKEMKRVAAMLAATEGDGEFEGFPGSGGAGIPTSPPPPPPAHDDFGPFTQAAEPHPHDDEEEAPDFGGEYVQRKRPGSARSGSDSRSRTSASVSDRPPRTPTSATSPPTTTTSSSAGPAIAPPKVKKKKPSSKKSKSSSSASQSQSLPSPPLSPGPPVIIQGHSEDLSSSRGFPSPGLSFSNNSGFPSTGFSGTGGFPSTGLGGTGFGRKRGASGAGVALARRGDE